MNAYASMHAAVADPVAVQEAPVLRLVAPALLTRSGYQPSRRSAPVALAASLGIVAALGSALVMLGGSEMIVKKQKPLVVTMQLLPPPPPPEAAPEIPPPPAAPVLTAPLPIVRVPSPAPVLAAVAPVEQPTQPVVFAVAAPAASVSSAPPAPPATSVDGDLTVNMLDATPPRYPTESRRKREEGTVRLSVLVGLDGRVADVGVASSSGSDRLDKAAVAAVKRWRWSPLTRAGTALMVRGIVTIPFVLRA